jgi:MarR family transcriptional regulator for hemolysin
MNEPATLRAGEPAPLLRLFTRAHKLLRGAVDEAMAQHGVRVGQNLVLEVLWDTDGLTPGDLANRLGVTVPTMVKSATRMEAAGLLTRRRDDKDGRLVRLYLTDHARSVRGAIEDARSQLEQHVTATLTSAERRHVQSALTKIIKQLTDAPPDQLRR